MHYKQQSSQGCLVINLFKPTKEKEQEILSDRLFRLRENYMLGCLQKFLDRYRDGTATLYVDNNFYLNIQKQWIKHPGTQ